MARAHRGELGLDVDELAGPARRCAMSAERLDDVRLRRDRVGASPRARTARPPRRRRANLRFARASLGQRPGFLAHVLVGLAGGGDVGSATAGELVADRLPTAFQRDQPADGREAAQQRRVGQSTPAEVRLRAISPAGTLHRRSRRKRRTNLRRRRVRRSCARVDQHAAPGIKPAGRRRPGAAASGPG